MTGIGAYFNSALHHRSQQDQLGRFEESRAYVRGPKEPAPTHSRGTAVSQAGPLQSDLKTGAISGSHPAHEGLAYLFGNAGTAAFLEYGDLGSYDGSMTCTGRC